jgi:hypothetical protein
MPGYRHHRSALFAQPLLKILTVDDAEDQDNASRVNDLVHDPIVSDAHSQKLVLCALDSLDQLTGRSWVHRQGVDGSL